MPTMSKQPQGTKERIEEGDKVKFKPFGHPVTANEIHSAQLGIIGLFTGLAYSTGLQKEALGASALLIGLAFGIRSLPESKGDLKIPVAYKTKRHEPWWFTTVYTVTFFAALTLA